MAFGQPHPTKAIACDAAYRGVTSERYRDMLQEQERSAIPPSTVLPEIQTPLRRADIEMLAGCIKAGDFAALRDRSARAADAAEIPDLSGVSVLAVDDNAVNREVLNEALKSLRIAAHLVGSGEDAIAAVQRGRERLQGRDEPAEVG